jgi:pyrroloquinoline quinone biosynthesis protein E
MRPIRLHEIDFYVTMRCNLRCEFCSVRAGEYDHDDLPLARCRSLIDEAARLGLRDLHFLGGEPTLRLDLEAMVEHAAAHGLSTRVITNGLLLDGARIRRFIGAGLQELMVSIDGLPPAHNALRRSGPGGWPRAMQCVDDAVAAGIRTRVAMTAYRDNLDDVLPLLRLVNERGVNRFSVFLGSPLGRGHGMIRRVLDPYTWRTLQEAVAAEVPGLRPELDIIMEQGFAWADGPRVDRSQIKGRGTGCNTLLEDYDYLIVRSDGNLYQCVFFMTEGRPIGNVRTQPLEPTLQYALERAEYRSFTRANDRCVACAHQEDCGTGCRGYAYLLAQDWLRTDPRCAKSEPGAPEAPSYYPLCPILKWNVRTGAFGGSSEDALRR